MRLIVLKYSTLLLAGLFFEFWATSISPLDLPLFIPQTPINIRGLILIVLFLATLIFLEKGLLKSNPELTITNLTFQGLKTCLISETIFQAFRILYQNEGATIDKLYYFTTSSINTTIFGTALAFLIAFQIKTKKTRQLIVLVILFIGVVNIVQYFRH